MSRFTERAERAVLIAQEEAKRMNHDYVGTEHELLGLIALAEGTAAQVICNFRVDLRAIRARIEKIIGTGNNVMLLGEIPFTPRAKKVLEFAVEEAQAFGHNYVGTEHLLLGMLREEEGIAATVLEEFGFTVDNVRQEVKAILSGEKETPIEIDQEPWYTMADAQEVYNALNVLAMGFESFHYMDKSLSVVQYDFDDNTFFKAEQLWAEREGLA